MIRLSITLNNDALAQLTALMQHVASAGTLPGTESAMQLAAYAVAEKWKDYAGGGSLPGVKPLKVPTSAYARSIHVEYKGPFDYEIVSNVPQAAYLEYGTKAIDFKKTHPYGPRSRMGKNGPYLIVPFRWGTPGTKLNPRVGFRRVMPQAVYKIAKNFAMTHVNEQTKFSPNAFGQLVERYTYTWGERLSPKQAQMAGMVRTEGFAQQRNGSMRPISSGYFTFRILSVAKPLNWDKRPHRKSWEESWKKPEQAPRPITRTVARVVEPTVNAIVADGIQQDIERL
jgi:hypothetical protein